MQYIKHNFAHNYNQYKKYGEYRLLNDMVLDDVSKLIVFDKSNLLITIASSGYGINRKPSNEEIAKMLKKYIPKDKRLRENISKLIIINNSGDKNKSKSLKSFNNVKFNTGDYDYSKSKQQKNVAETSLKSLAKQVKETFRADGDVMNRVNQHLKNKAQMEGQAVTQEEMKKAVRKAQIKSSLITAIAIIGGYFLLKKLTRLPMFAQGGIAEAQEPIIHQVPQAPADIPQAEYQQVPVPNDGFDANGIKIN